MRRAHAQLPYSRSDSTASLASSGVGIVAQEANTSAGTPIAIKTVLTSTSERATLALETSALVFDGYSQRRTRAL
jgi:hypothetical protein